MDYQLILELVEAQKQEIVGLKKDLEFAEREKKLQEKVIELKDREIEIMNRSFDQMKEIADRAIKLAETSKPKSNWALLGTVLLAVFTLGLVVGM
jgi:mevalonate kinase